MKLHLTINNTAMKYPLSDTEVKTKIKVCCFIILKRNFSQFSQFLYGTT